MGICWISYPEVDFSSLDPEVEVSSFLNENASGGVVIVKVGDERHVPGILVLRF